MGKSQTKKGPRIYVATDLEGISGVWRFDQTRDRESPLYAQAVEYLMGDIAALVRGLREGGASKIVVSDMHGGGNNFVPHIMEPGATYITGRPRETRLEIDKSFDGIILLGFHAMKGTSDGVLNHTQSSVAEKRYWYNGRESGEIAQLALLAGNLDIPVIMVTGDKATCREARRFLGKNVVTVATKKGINREAAELYSFEETRKAILSGAKRALTVIDECEAYKLPMPIKCKCQWIKRLKNTSENQVASREATIKDVKNIVTF